MSLGIRGNKSARNTQACSRLVVERDSDAGDDLLDELRIETPDPLHQTLDRHAPEFRITAGRTR